MATFDPKSTSKLISALHFRYSIVIEARLEISTAYFYFCATFAKLLFLYNYRKYTCSAPLIETNDISIINTICEYVILHVI